MKNKNIKIADSVRAKICAHCNETIEVAFRVRVAPSADWIFVCTDCCRKAGSLPGYQYGGTWKGRRK